MGRWTVLGSCLLLPTAVWAAGSSPLPESARQAIEADWQRQDEGRVALLTQPNLIRLPGQEINWPGLPIGAGQVVPLAPAPALDGRLEEPCWARALAPPPPQAGDPALWLCHDGQRLYVGAKIAADQAWRFRGEATAADAAGAVDGVKNGLYAFHTGGDPDPWWQVDLGQRRPIGRVIVYNRLDYLPGLHNADTLDILTSDDGQTWTLRHHNTEHFGGVSGAPPLEVTFENVAARFLRLQVPGNRPILFHLDEVEVYPPGDDSTNLALRQPATQSTLSIWSKGGLMGTAFLQVGRARLALTRTDPPQLTINGQPAETGVVQATPEGLTVESSLQVESDFAGQVLLTGAVPITVRLGAPWKVAWPQDLALSHGRNRLALTVEDIGALDPAMRVTAETVVLTPFGLNRRTVAEAEVRQGGPVSLEVPVGEEGAAAVIVTFRQGPAELTEARAFLVPPVRETLGRAEALLGDFGALSPQLLAQARDLRARLRELEGRETAQGADPPARRELYREARWLAREVAFSNPALDFRELLFVKRHVQQTYADVCLNHMPWTSRPGGDVCVLSPLSPAGEVRPLLDGRLGPGHVHGMDLAPDGRHVAFGYAGRPTDEPAPNWMVRPASFDLRVSEEPIHIFELDLATQELRQLTDGEWSDLDPAYLPDGDVAFVSERCGTSLQCNEYDKDETSCNLYAVRPGTGEVRRLSVSKDGDYLPHLLDNGLLAYTRWEYHERNWANVQSIWFVAPDGTQADALFKQHFNDPWALEEMRSIPGSHRLLAIATGHHTLPTGPVVMIDHHQGINEPLGIGIVTPGVLPPEGGMTGQVVPEGGVIGLGGQYGTPFALSDKHFLVSYTYGPSTDENGYGLYLIDVYGTRELVYRDPAISSLLPIPLRARSRPPRVHGSVEPDQREGLCIVTDIYEGVEGIDRGRIKYLRISEPVGWPYNNTEGGLRYEPDLKQVMLNWTPVRVLGTVPVEPDGSAWFRVPPDTAVYFQALDENQMELQRMRSFINLQPGEVRSCAGCHETRAAAPANPPTALALRHPPSPLEPPPWGSDRAISFLRDVQPVFDRHCAGCHAGLKPAGGLDFSGGLTERYNRAWETINVARLVSRSNVGEDARITKPLEFGSHKSRLIEVVRSGHQGRLNVPPEDLLRLVIWVDANAIYDAGFINKRVPVQPYNLAADAGLKGLLGEAHGRRCAGCHDPAAVSRTDWIDLADPPRSRFLAAPLAQEAGGLGRCGDVYATAQDPDYAALLAATRQAVEESWKRPRRDVVTLARPSRTVAAR
jgi:mono/diheme cytochrome c family protein